MSESERKEGHSAGSTGGADDDPWCEGDAVVEVAEEVTRERQ